MIRSRFRRLGWWAIFRMGKTESVVGHELKDFHNTERFCETLRRSSVSIRQSAPSGSRPRPPPNLKEFPHSGLANVS